MKPFTVPAPRTVVTLKQVADAAGVSLACVSYALRQDSKITAATRERVKENFEALAVTLSPEVLAELDRAFPSPKRKQSLEIL